MLAVGPFGLSVSTNPSKNEFFAITGRERPPRRARSSAREHRDGRRESVPLLVRIYTAIEAAYFTAGGILPYVLEQLLAQDAREA